MKKIKKISSICFVLLLSALCGVTLCQSAFVANENTFAQSALYSGEVVNNVLFLTFKDGDTNWINEVPECAQGKEYTLDVRSLMQNSYNDSTSSVKNFYKVQSYGNLDLKSTFYANGENAYTIPYYKNELLPYSPTNTDGYLEYEICSYSGNSAPNQLSTSYFYNTSHLFSCYNCGNSNHDGTGSNCDLDTSDDIACLCAYYQKKASTSKIHNYEHLERHFREQVALKSVLQQANLTGNLDNNGDNFIDALTFIFEGVSESVGWNDLLWAHQSAFVDLSALSSMSSFLPTILSNRGVRDASQSDFSSTLEVILSNVKKGGKTCYNYNLYLFSDLFMTNNRNQPIRLTGADGKEIISNYTLAHELGHVLGLPDYYVYDNDKNANDEPVLFWDLMAYSYAGVPLYLSSYNREQLGFTTDANIIKLTSEGTYQLKPTTYDEVYNDGKNSGNVLAYVYEDSQYPGQKIYMEYRNQEGIFESGIKDIYNLPNFRKDGLIVYRVDENIEQVEGYNTGLSSGNFFGYPYNMYVFRNSKTDFALNSNNKTIENITFQSYDSSKNQKELLYNDVTFNNSGLKIEFVKLENGSISFKVTGGKLAKEDTRDLSQIKLIGNENINHEVNTPYGDEGINYGEFSSSEFELVKTDNVTPNISNLGKFTYTYKLTLKNDQSKSITLTRVVSIVDTTAPVLTLKGDETVVVERLDIFVDEGVDYHDNYNAKADLTLVTGEITKVSENYYKIEYTVTDTSGNSATITRYILVRPNTDFSSIKLKGEEEVSCEVNTQFVDAGIDWGTFSESDFTREIENNVIITTISAKGEYYTYVYKLTFKLTGEKFSLTRKVRVVDITSPTITIKGKTNLTYTTLASYKEMGVEYSDNYDQIADLTLTISAPFKVSENRYKIVYTVKDKSGNTATAERYIEINPNYFSSVKLVGEKEVVCEVNTAYNDEGITFGDFNKDDFDIEETNSVDINVITTNGLYYNYSYKLTKKDSGESFTLIRKVKVQDSVAPTITLLGDNEIELYPSELLSYSDRNILVSDNYCAQNQILVNTRLVKISDTIYHYFYKATDTSGNESNEIYRIIKIKTKTVSNSQIIIDVNDSSSLAEEYYVGKTIKFKVNINLTEDNNKTQTIKFFIDGKEMPNTTGYSFYYEFENAGTYNIKIQVGESASKELTIVVKDAQPAETQKYNQTLIIALGAGGGGLVVMGIIIAIVSRKKRIRVLEGY